LDAAIASGNKPNASAQDKELASIAQGIKNDPVVMSALTQKPGAVFVEGAGFTIADVKRSLGIT
jgi:hypothetical protein